MARRKPYTVTVVNPTERKAKKKVAKKKTKKKAAKKKATKKKATKKATRKRPMAKKKTRKRGGSRKRKSRKNPSRRTRARVRAATRRGKYFGGFLLDPAGALGGLPARLAGKIATAYCVRRFGGLETAPISRTTGSAWTFKQYFIAWLTGYLGGELATRMVGAKAGAEFYQGSVDMTATKMMWSELIQRWDPAKAALGQGDYQSQLNQMAMGATEGDVLDDGQGNRWLCRGGKWVSMQGGEMGQLVEADHLGQLVEADYLGDDEGMDNEPEAGMGQLVEADYLGHQMPVSSTTPEDANQAEYLRRGSNDPYHSSFM